MRSPSALEKLEHLIHSRDPGKCRKLHPGHHCCQMIHLDWDHRIAIEANEMKFPLKSIQRWRPERSYHVMGKCRRHMKQRTHLEILASVEGFIYGIVIIIIIIISGLGRSDQCVCTCEGHLQLSRWAFIRSPPFTENMLKVNRACSFFISLLECPKSTFREIELVANLHTHLPSTCVM